MEKQDFIKKFHTIKTYRFEPLTWEEFFKTRDISNGILAHWFCGDISIVMSEENNEDGVLKQYNRFEVSIFADYDKDKNFYYINECGVDNREKTYYKALEYAQKLFLGD